MTDVVVNYPEGIAALGRKEIDLESDTLNLLCLGDNYTYSSAHDDIADFASTQIGTGTAVAGTRTMFGGSLITDTALTTLPSVPVDANSVGGILLYHLASGTPITLWQKKGDTTPIVVESDGGDIEIEFTTPLGGGFEITRF